MVQTANPAVVAEDAIDLSSPEFYVNRELSLLEFNRRVLAQSLEPNVPLLERLRYLCISCTNLDEFFEVRVAGLKQRLEHGSQLLGYDDREPRELLAEISTVAHGLVDEQYRILNELLIPQMQQEGIRFLRRGEWDEAQRAWLRDFFEEQLLPVLSPLGLDPAHPFPRILNKSLNFIVQLEGKDAFGRNLDYAVVQAPRALPRVIKLPPEVAPDDHCFVFLSSVIHAFVDDLFPGMEVLGCFQFRVTRNSDLFVDEEQVDDLLRALEGELPGRRYGDEVRLEMVSDAPDNLGQFLLPQFGLTDVDLYMVNGPVNLNRLSAVIDEIDRPELKFTGFTPRLPGKMGPGGRLFSEIAKRDILLHHPYDSFVPVVEFLKQAAEDPKVLAIKQTLYRTGSDSAIVAALVKAARAGKEVTVVVELRARFDEEDNIQLANRLQAAGAHVVYGVVGYKTHAKMILVVRREEAGALRHYVHLGTGNYHSRTARIYTDYGLFTADKRIGQDIHHIFMQLTSLGKSKNLKEVLHSPFTLHGSIIEKIAREADNARAGKASRIIAKMNQLTEPGVIRALYEASQAGVQIDLVVRGMTSLRPGVAGVSDNIRLRSVIGRFLEHTRVYYFLNDGPNGREEELYASSADWMERNLLHRVETCFPIKDKKLRKKVMAELDLYLQDNFAAWELQADGKYQRVSPADDGEANDAQQILLKQLTE
jgi:polyphosphate kinase